MSTMNPQIRSTEIGVRDIKKITIFPLSMADQFKLSEIISNAITEYSETEEDSDIDIFKKIMEVIRGNLIIILELVTDEKEDISLDDITNDQFVELCDIIYSVNFDSAIVKFQSLFNNAKKAFPSKRQFQKSSSTPVTDVNISSSSDTEMGE